MQLANHNSSLDIGFFGEYYANSALRYCGAFYKASNLGFQLFENLTVQPGNTVNTSDSSYQLANLSINNLTAAAGSFTGNLTNSILSTNGSGVLQNLVIGSGLSYTSNTLAPVLNTTNLQISAGAINTSQDIASTSSPIFSNLSITNTITNGTWNGSIIGVTYGGTGVNNGSLTINLSSGAVGDVLASDSSGNATWQALSSLGVTSITGTANQVIASSSTGSVTLSTPQDIATSSSPTFAGLTITGLFNNTIYNKTYVQNNDWNAHHYKIATLPVDNGGDYDYLHLIVTLNVVFKRLNELT